MKRSLIVLTVSLFSVICCLGQVPSENPKNIPVYTYFIVNSIPHDFNAYTQGLAFDNGFLYEGTGKKPDIVALTI